MCVFACVNNVLLNPIAVLFSFPLQLYSHSRNQTHSVSNSELPGELQCWQECVCVCLRLYCMCVCVCVCVEWIDGVMWCDGTEEKKRLSSRAGLLTLMAQLLKTSSHIQRRTIRKTHTSSVSLFTDKAVFSSNIQCYQCLCYVVMMQWLATCGSYACFKKLYFKRLSTSFNFSAMCEKKKLPLWCSCLI